MICYEGLTRLPGARTEDFVFLGQAFMAAGRRDEAIGAFSAAIERSQSYSAPYRLRGVSQWLSDRDAALRDLIRADSLDPRGAGRGREFIKEMESWERECESRIGPSCLRLAKRYEGGGRVVRDRATARTFFQRACEIGVVEACSKVQ